MKLALGEGEPRRQPEPVTQDPDGQRYPTWRFQDLRGDSYPVPQTMNTKLDLVLQPMVCSWLDKAVVDRLNRAAIDFTSRWVEWARLTPAIRYARERVTGTCIAAIPNKQVPVTRSCLVSLWSAPSTVYTSLARQQQTFNTSRQKKLKH